MGIGRLWERSDALVGVQRDLRKLPRLYAQLIARRMAITRYLESHTIKKLQLGSGSTTLSGWLCTDLIPDSNDVVYLDATKPYPFKDNTFDYVYSEHMIEHVSERAGSRMLTECIRVLKPGGTIRIATPDLEVLVGLYKSGSNISNKAYIEWSTDRYLKHVNACKAQYVINNEFHNWGHQFLYDGDVLKFVMQRAGFVNLKRCSVGESNDANLRGIEHHGDSVGNPDMVRFETLVLEGRRPLLASTAAA